MIQIIIFIVLLILALALAGIVVRSALKVAAVLAGVALAVVFAIPVALGMGAERLTRRNGVRALASKLAIAVGAAMALWIGYAGYGWRPGLCLDSVKYLVPALLPVFIIVLHQRRLHAERDGHAISLPADTATLTYRLLFASISIWLYPVVLQSAFPFLVTRIFSSSSAVWWWDLFYFASSCLVMLAAMGDEHVHARLIRAIKAKIGTNDSALNLTETVAAWQEQYPYVKADRVEAIALGVATAAKNSGATEMYEVCNEIWLFEAAAHARALTEYRSLLERDIRHVPKVAKQRFRTHVPMPSEAADDYFDRYLDFVEQYDFDDGPHLVAYGRKGELNCCSSCGLTRENGGNLQDDWYCSPTCRETETVCTAIQKKPLREFLSEAASTGFVVIEMAGAWSQNHKMVADGGQGHGFAAERANTMHDKRMGRSAQVIGDDNAKNGADRLVDGQEIQTKYCSTGARSIGSAFDNKGDGSFRYYDANHKPMPIEVPRDQYDQAVQTMARKIDEGKVPGVTDPTQAKELVVKGHLTYAQAKSITQFGTFESLKYDVQEGAIVSLGAGGISFAVTATISYLNTNDTKKALQAACLQGGKTFGRTLIVYAGTQQLHRLATVQAAVKYIDVGTMSKPMAEALQKSMGVSSTNQLNHALRGTVVASLVIVAVSTGPDLLKMVRGRVSGAQFTKNLSVAASSTAGGAVGAIAGGALGASFGPVGIWVGKFAGGVIGGAVAGAVTNTIAKSMMKEDRERMLEIVQRQIEYLAVLFMLTEREVESLSANLNNVITPKALETMYASRAHKAFANMLVKPIVVGIIKQRPVLRYDVGDVLASFDGHPRPERAANDAFTKQAAA